MISMHATREHTPDAQVHRALCGSTLTDRTRSEFGQSALCWSRTEADKLAHIIGAQIGELLFSEFLSGLPIFSGPSPARDPAAIS